MTINTQHCVCVWCVLYIEQYTYITHHHYQPTNLKYLNPVDTPPLHCCGGTVGRTIWALTSQSASTKMHGRRDARFAHTHTHTYVVEYVYKTNQSGPKQRHKTTTTNRKITVSCAILEWLLCLYPRILCISNGHTVTWWHIHRHSYMHCIAYAVRYTFAMIICLSHTHSLTHTHMPNKRTIEDWEGHFIIDENAYETHIHNAHTNPVPQHNHTWAHTIAVGKKTYKTLIGHTSFPRRTLTIVRVASVILKHCVR